MKRLFFQFFTIVVMTLLPFAAIAQQDQSPVDVRLVIDVSGSMKGNDPSNLRQPAVELLVELLPEKSKAGVWTFGKWVNMLISHKEVGPDWRDAASTEAKNINSVGLYTNIGEALEKAAYDIDYSDPKQSKHIILLTDGMVDIDKDANTNSAEWRRIVDEVLPKLNNAGYKIHTIALSKNADRDLMDRLSVSTDGVADTAQSAEDLMKIFLKAFDAAVPAEQVALTDNAFVIDSSVEEFTALIFRKQSDARTQLVSPDEQLWDAATRDEDVRWHRTNRYDLITVKRPLEGEWGIVGDIDPESRVTVVSNLNLRLKPLPNNALKGAVLPLSVQLQEDGKTITNSEFLSLMDMSVELMGGNSFDALVSIWDTDIKPVSPSEGRYEVDLPELDKEGVYQVKVRVDGKTFSRELKHQITLRQSFSADVREQYQDGALRYVLTVNAYMQGIDYTKTQVVAAVTTPAGQKLVRPLSISELDTWQGAIVPDDEGSYTARIQVKGATVNGEFFEYELDPLRFNYSASGGVIEEQVSFSEPEPETESQPIEATPDDEVESEPETETETNSAPPQEESALPNWMLYAALGVGNLILLIVGYVVVKKIMSGPKEDILDELDQEPEDAPAQTQEIAGDEQESDAEEEEEEPPMEDLDPETPPEQESIHDSSAGDEIETLELDNDDGVGSMSEQNDVTDEVSPFDVDDELDDLDAMAMEIAEETAADDGASDPSDKSSELGDNDELDDDDDDMVTAMLKAQGLDLAEDELDDAISSLIDDLDDDDEEKP